MASKSSVKIADEKVEVDPQLLFQRLIIACDNSQLEKLFQYKLCTYPTTLLDSLWKKLTPEAKTQPKGNVQHMLDGGALLHRVPWPRGSPTYKVVCDLHCIYVQRNYGGAIVVLTGTTKCQLKL